ncbi:MAG TPA: type II toxin-antitoxin system PemK/MazF family toxin [Polyangiaceae bacterium]
MPSTTTFERGAVVLVRFVFADEQGAKRRPVLVLSTSVYHSGRQEIIVAALTSNVERLLPGDRVIREWRAAGLPKPSVATGILRTIEVSMIEIALGHLRSKDLKEVEAALRETLGL